MQNQATSSQTQSQSDQNRYWDLITIGSGNLYDIRVVQPQSKKAQPMLCVRIKALCGPSDDIEPRWFDVNVVGEKAKELVSKCLAASQAKCKIFAKFSIGDIYVQSYTVTHGDDAGQTRYVFKGRLLRIFYLTIDKKLVHREEKDNSQASSAASSVQNIEYSGTQTSQSSHVALPNTNEDQSQYDSVPPECATTAQPDPLSNQLLETYEQF